jgi:nitroimidazol reductase NimA-like FMN-containing flavoprotein (pyridoxamine 5'-phosphate oxidase superfamily)
MGCLNTCDNNCNPSGATVFYAVHNDKLYILTHEQSLKVKHIKANPNVCIVIVDDTYYKQMQLYATAKLVKDTGKHLPLIRQVMAEHSEKSDSAIPYTEITTEGTAPAIIELTPKHGKYFESGVGIVEESYTK